MNLDEWRELLGPKPSDDLFGGTSLHEQIECVRRELIYRVRVFKRRVAEKRMTPELADREIHRMRAVENSLWEYAQLRHRDVIPGLRQQFGGPL